MARSDRVRQALTLPKELREQLAEIARAPGVTKSKILTEALANWFEHKGATELELICAKRLDRLSNQLARLERNNHIGFESFGLFVRYYLTVTAPIPADDEAARAIGRERYKAFIDQVGRNLAAGRPALLPDDDEEDEQ